MYSEEQFQSLRQRVLSQISPNDELIIELLKQFEESIKYIQFLEEELDELENGRPVDHYQNLARSLFLKIRPDASRREKDLG